MSSEHDGEVATERNGAAKAGPERERLLPDLDRNEISYAEHWARYCWAAPAASGKRVADIACGTGYGSEILANAGATLVAGVDISQDALSYAAERYRSDRHVHFVRGDAARVPFADAFFDVAVSFETIEHLNTPRQLVAEIARLLTPTGVFIVSTPNPRVYPSGNPFHISELAPNDFEALLRDFFPHVEMYYQSDWLCSVILSTEDASVVRMEQHLAGTFFKASALPVAECSYLIAMCSRAPLPRACNLVGVLIRDQTSQLQNTRNLEAAVRKRDALIPELVRTFEVETAKRDALIPELVRTFEVETAKRDALTLELIRIFHDETAKREAIIQSLQETEARLRAELLGSAQAAALCEGLRQAIEAAANRPSLWARLYRRLFQ